MTGHLIFSKVIKTNSRQYKVQQFKFKNSTDCTAHYNKLVKTYADGLSNKTLSYHLNDWASNNFIKNNKPLSMSRFGKIIQIIESKQIMELTKLKNDFSEIYNKIKTLKH